MKIRQTFKATVHRLLDEADFDRTFVEIRSLPPKKVINALLPKLLSLDEEQKWRAVTAAGIATADLAETDMEAARIIMRRMIWNLTEESGGCAWGAPELMAEAMANHRKLAEEFSKILVSFIVPQGNYLEFEPLQRGAVWGIGRLAQVHPDLVQGSQRYLCDLLKSGDYIVRGLACWVLNLVSCANCADSLEALTSEENSFLLYKNRQLMRITVGALALEALKRSRKSR